MGHRKEPVHNISAFDKACSECSYRVTLSVLPGQQAVLLLQRRPDAHRTVWKCLCHRYGILDNGDHLNRPCIMTFEFDGIEYGYDDRRLLTSVHIKCEQGKIVGLLGRNGTGKTTLMKIAFGAIRPYVASIRLDGRSLLEPPFALGLVSYLPQESFIPTDLTLSRSLGLLQVHVDKIVAHFPEMKSDLDLYPAQVSGGRLRLFEVLAVLFRSTPFCLLDEPFTGLSPLFVERLQEILLMEKEKKGILISDQLFRQVLSIADNVYLLSNGNTFLVKEQEDLSRRGYVLV